eukprot:1178618-Prorocentrum_minimum.AAC.3
MKSSSLEPILSTSGVWVNCGQMAHTLTLHFRCSHASDLTKCTAPPLEAAYVSSPGPGINGLEGVRRGLRGG